MGKKRKLAKDNDLEYDPVPKHLVTSHIKKQEKRLIVILENAQLETVKVSFKCLLVRQIQNLFVSVIITIFGICFRMEITSNY